MRHIFRGMPMWGLMARYPVIPHDKQQALRIRRLFMASGTYAMTFLLGYIGGWLGLVEFTYLYVLWSIIVLSQIIFYAVIRSSLNLKLADPSMTELQMYAATFFLMYCMYFAYRASDAFVLVYMILFLFGVFSLDTRRFLKITLFALATYGLAIYLLYAFRPHGIDFKAELLKWMSLAILLPCFSFIGGYISSLRLKLRKSYRDLDDALRTIKEMAIRDDLTGLLNRRHLMETLEIESRRAIRSGQLFSLMMMDIDGFKKVNDTFGHATGDAIIKEVAGITSDTLRTTDYCGRYGGDEFILLLIQTTKEGAAAYAERIRSRIASTAHPALGPDFRLTVSLGITEYHMREDLAKTISRADEALYRAKHAGRNRIECILVSDG